MRNALVTPFWQRAARSLPAHVRERYIGQLARAERWELALDGWIELVSRAKSQVGRSFHASSRPDSA